MLQRNALTCSPILYKYDRPQGALEISGLSLAQSNAIN